MNPTDHLDFALACGVRFARHNAARLNTADARARWLDLHNKLAAFRLFTGAPASRSLDPYSRLFAAEGFAYRQSRSAVPLRDLLQLDINPISVHAGAGLALAQQTLRKLQTPEFMERRSTRMYNVIEETHLLREPNADRGIRLSRRNREILDAFFDICNRDARGGFAGIMHEMLGFTACVRFPRLIGTLSQTLHDADAAHRARFWHGVGRANYFLPRHLPVFHAAPWRGVAMCHAAADDELSRKNALSGFSFALTLVNLHAPDVLNAFARHHDTSQPAIADGMESARAVSRSECARPEILFSLPAVPAASQPIAAARRCHFDDFPTEVKR